MKVEIVVPQIGEAIAELTLISWLKQVGDPIRKGEVLFEVDSDKAIVEVEAYVDGTLSEILFPAGSVVFPQQVVAIVQTETAEESLAAVDGTSERSVSESEKSSLLVKTTNGHKVSPVALRLALEMGVDPDQITGSGPGGRVTSNDIRRVATQRGQEPDVTVDVPSQGVNASPKAKRLAKELQVELRGLKGTGVAGMIRVKDVELAAQTAITTSAGGDRLSLSKLRQTVALRTQESKQTIPHFYLMVDVDMTQVNRLRSYCLENLGWQRPPTYTDILVRACALALVDMPEANRSYNKGGWIVRQRIAIGVAVNTDQGLMVPVIRDADKLSLQDTVAALKAVAGRAREGRLRQTDLGEKSMVISNLGMYSVDTFIAIIDMPDPMILAVGRVADRLVPVDGQAVIRPMCTLTLSVDHRVLDGVQGAQFLERLKDRLENPFEVMG